MTKKCESIALSISTESNDGLVTIPQEIENDSIIFPKESSVSLLQHSYGQMSFEQGIYHFMFRHGRINKMLEQKKNKQQHKQ